MIIDDKHEDSFDENYHTFTNIVAPLVNYSAKSSQLRKTEMTLGQMFSSGFD
jgi:hypothetical protein